VQTQSQAQEYEIGASFFFSVGVAIHLLRSFDLTELQRITVENATGPDHLPGSIDQAIADAIAAGFPIPREVIEEYHPISPL